MSTASIDGGAQAVPKASVAPLSTTAGATVSKASSKVAKTMPASVAPTAYPAKIAANGGRPIPATLHPPQAQSRNAESTAILETVASMMSHQGTTPDPRNTSINIGDRVTIKKQKAPSERMDKVASEQGAVKLVKRKQRETKRMVGASSRQTDVGKIIDWVLENSPNKPGSPSDRP